MMAKCRLSVTQLSQHCFVGADMPAEWHSEGTEQDVIASSDKVAIRK
jgi:hypothetical protein